MSPSTLTRMIKQLEEEIGATLFERDNRRVALTREGELFRQYAIESKSLWSSFEEKLLDSAGQLFGTLELYGSVTASYSFMFDLLARLREQHPGIRIALQTGDPEQALERVQSGAAHISIGSRPGSLPGSVQFKAIATSDLVLIVPADFASSEAPDGSQPWQQEPFILPQRGVSRERITRWLRQNDLAPEIAAQVAGNEAIVSMVSLGSGIGVVPRIVLDNSPIRDRVKVVPVRSAIEPLEIGMFALRKNLKSRLVGALWNIGVA